MDGASARREDNGQGTPDRYTGMAQAVVAQLSFEQVRSFAESLATTEGRFVASDTSPDW